MCPCRKCYMPQKSKQDGQLAPAYFSPNSKYFDQLLQTVKNKTTVLNLVFKGFLQTSIPPLISILYTLFKKVSRFSVEFFCLTVAKRFVEEPFCVSENFWYRKMLGIREGGGYHDFSSKLFRLTVPKNFV